MDFKVVQKEIELQSRGWIPTFHDISTDVMKIVAEPSELIGTGVSVGPEYVEAATKCVKSVNPDILVLTAAGIANGTDVYNTIIAGADATGSSSGVAKAADRAAMVDEMIAAVRKAWDERH